jgi:Ca2+-binding EF-hand superfamily protein
MFKAIDDDGSTGIDQTELYTAFTEMQLGVSYKEVEWIFRSIDIDGGGTISQVEFANDVTEYISKDLDTLIYENKLREDEQNKKLE